MTDHRAAVRRLVDEVMNGRDLALLEELCTPRLAPKLRTAFASFLAAFPDWRQQLVELVVEDDTVAGRFRCHGTHTGPWQGLPASGRTMEVDEVYFFRFSGDRISGIWSLEDTWMRMRQLTGEDLTVGELGSLSEPSPPS